MKSWSVVLNIQHSHERTVGHRRAVRNFISLQVQRLSPSGTMQGLEEAEADDPHTTRYGEADDPLGRIPFGLEADRLPPLDRDHLA